MDQRTDIETLPRVLFCTCPSLYSDIVLKRLLDSPHLNLVGVVESTRILRKQGWGWWDGVQLLKKTGLHYASYLCMVTSLYTILRRFNCKFVPAAIGQNRIPLHATRDINNRQGIEFVQSCRPDMVLSAHFNQLIGDELLQLPPSGCINIHPGLLPEYRGVDPAFYALLRGEAWAGVTLHRQDSGFDTGMVITHAAVEIESGDTLLELNRRLFSSGAELFLQMLERAGELEAVQQSAEGGYDSWPDAGAVAELHRKGRKLCGIIPHLGLDES